MPIRLNGSTSGYTELSAPAVAGNNSIALPTGNGSAYQILRNGATAGSLEYVDNLVLGTAQNSTSGSVIAFSGIPSWVKRVTVIFNGVSTNGTSGFLMQIGPGASAEATGYSSATFAAQATSTSSAAATNTAAFLLANATAAAYVYNGSARLHNITGTTWVQDGLLVDTTGVRGSLSGGSKTLAGPLGYLAVTTVNGTDTFDAGSINILYE